MEKDSEKSKSKPVDKKEDKALSKKVEEVEKKIAVEVEKKLEKEAKEVEAEEKKIAVEIEKDLEKRAEEDKKASKPAVEKKTISKISKKDKTEKIELEREYVIPLKRKVLNVPRYRRAKKAIKVIREFLVRHMKIRDRDTKKIKIDKYLNNEIWFRGIKKPANKIKIRAVKKGNIVYVQLAEVPDVVKFSMAREEKRKQAAEGIKEIKKKKKTEEVKSREEKTEEKEDKKAGAELNAKTQKESIKTKKHTAKGAHDKKTMPVRKKLK